MREYNKVPSVRKTMSAKKSQTWSLDALIAMALFMVAIMAFFYITSYSATSKKTESIEQESQTLPESLLAEGNESKGFVIDNRINPEKLSEFANQSYDEIKKNLGIKNDFCIHIEDENGFLILINNKTGIGSSKAMINGSVCG